VSEAGARDIGLLHLLADAWSLVLLTLRALQPLMVVALLGLLAWALLSRQPWPFSIEAKSEHVTLLPARELETNWRIDGALLCVRSTDAAVVAAALPGLDGDSPCPGRRWRAFDLRGMEEVALRLPAMPGAAPGYAVRLDVERDGSLAMQVSGEGDGMAPLAVLAGGEAAPLEIGQAAILRFPVPREHESPGRLLLPFAGAGAIGKDVSWREPTLLRSGTVSLYTRSEEAAGGRELVTTTELLPGDRVDLGQRDGRGGSVTKGFVHFDLAPGRGEPAAMTVVALGEADAVRIVRFGDQGYSFSPGLFAELTRHRAVATWAVLIVSVLGFIAIVRDEPGLGEGRFAAWRRKFAADWRGFRGGHRAERE
jgi:hypothetical protein